MRNEAFLCSFHSIFDYNDGDKIHQFTKSHQFTAIYYSCVMNINTGEAGSGKTSAITKLVLDWAKESSVTNQSQDPEDNN